MKQETEFIVKSRLNEVAFTAAISEQIPVSGKGIFSSFIKGGLEELKRNCSSPRRGRRLLARPARSPQVRISITANWLYNLIEGAHNSYASTKEVSLSKGQMPSQIRTFSDVKPCPLTHLDRKLFKPKTTFGPPTTSLPACSSGWHSLCC